MSSLASTVDTEQTEWAELAIPAGPRPAPASLQTAAQSANRYKILLTVERGMHAKQRKLRDYHMGTSPQFIRD